MKKILALVLALCLTLALTCTAFADKSPTLDPSPSIDPSPFVPNVNPNGGVSSGATSKFTYSATDANGAPVMITMVAVTEGAIYDEVAAFGVKGVFNLSVLSAVTGPITINVYCPGASSNSKVIVRDAWELLEGANLKASGDRVTFTADAETINEWHYFAIVDNFEAVAVDTPTEAGDNTEDVEGDNVNVDDNTPAPAPEKNPTTGVALAVVPMIVAAAAIVASKKR